jgi:hypothetical protein
MVPAPLLERASTSQDAHDRYCHEFKRNYVLEDTTRKTNSILLAGVPDASLVDVVGDGELTR